MKRITKPALLIIAAILLLVGGYQWAIKDGHRDPLPGDVGKPMHISMAAFERVIGTGVLRCGYYDAPPYIVKTETLGSPTGPVVDIIYQLGKLIGIRVEFVESPLGRQQDDLVEARIDAHCFDAVQSPLHFQRFDLGQPLLASPLYTYVAASSTLDGGSDLNSEKTRFAIADGDIALQIVAKRYTDAQVVLVPTSGAQAELYNAVTSGKADAVVADALSIAVYNAAHPDKKLRRQSDVSLLLLPHYIITAKGDPALRNMIDDGLRQLIDQGRYAQILHQIDSSGRELRIAPQQLVPFSSR